MQKLKKISALLLDVDGVLTKGNIYYTEKGTEIKVFNAKDGLGLKLLMQANIHIGIITGRSSAALNHRCSDLGISIFHDNIIDKQPVFDTILKKYNLNTSQVAYMGDDLPDLPLIKKAGCGITVADAHPVVQKHADFVTTANGGNGAVREVCDKILQAQGLWDKVIDKYLN